MCGIAGVLTLPGGHRLDPSLLARMTDSIIHRGPDGRGHHVDPPVLMGMRRLSIIDVAGGDQPIGNEDGAIQVVFNGEIYNYRELRADLELRGHRFRTQSDTEVLVHLYEEHGDDFPVHLNGMFAFALHDRTKRRVLLARDQIGIKPLFVARLPGHVVFGSEIKALLACDLVPRELDHDALAEFMAWEYVPAPRTLIRAIRKLEPGCTLSVDLADGSIVERRFWDLPAAGQIEIATPDEWADRLDAALAAAVRRQMVADVPLGALLSGGVDSSVVVANMGKGALTFSIGFDDASYDELPHARRVANDLGVRHQVEIIRPDVRGMFDDLMHFMDDPIADFSIFPTYLVSRLARRDVTVALSGDGGDELFGGYDTFVAQAMAARWQRLPGFLRNGVLGPMLQRLPPQAQKKGLINKAKRFAEGANLDPALGHARWRLFADAAMRATLFTAGVEEVRRDNADAHIRRYMAEAASRDPVDRALHVDMKSYLVDNCLVKVDRMSMANSLEVRVPLLDMEIVDLAFRMPSTLKLDNGQTKPLLKQVTARHVPRESVYRTKQGFSIPIKHWLNDTFKPLTEELLAPERLRADGLFQPETVAHLRAEHAANRANHSHIIWAMLVFQDWRTRWNVSL